MEKGESQSEFWQREGKMGRPGLNPVTIQFLSPALMATVSSNPQMLPTPARRECGPMSKLASEVPTKIMFIAVNC